MFVILLKLATYFHNNYCYLKIQIYQKFGIIWHLSVIQCLTLAYGGNSGVFRQKCKIASYSKHMLLAV